jgi:hypothetical protein
LFPVLGIAIIVCATLLSRKGPDERV